MKKIIVLITILFCFSNLYSQTAIGTRSPAQSAIMELNVSNLAVGSKKGLLLNRVALINDEDITTIANPVGGLIIYNTATTTGNNAVQANNIYIWNASLQKWERYFSRDEIFDFVIPEDFSIKSGTNQTTASLGTSIVEITWQSSDIVVANNDIVLLDANNISFSIKKSGLFDLTGYFNYTAQLSESTSTRTTTSNQTDVVFQIQRSTDGGGLWDTINAITTTIGRGIGNTYSSILIPSMTVSLNENDKIRFVVNRNSGLNRLAHGTSAGILATASQPTKSVRFSYVVGLN